MQLLVYLFLRLLVVLPERAQRAAGAGFARLALALPGKWARLPLDNLERVDPGIGRREGKRVVRRLAGEMTVNFCEAARLFDREMVGRRVKISGLEHLEKALERGRGAILLSAHLGNFPLILAALHYRRVPVNHIGRNPSNRWLSCWFDRVRERAGLPVIPQNPASAATMAAARWLRRGGALSLPADQYASREISGAVFFGYRGGTPAGPDFFARRLGCAVVPVFIRRRGRRHDLRIYPELEVRRSGMPEEDSRLNGNAFNRVIEEQAGRAPDQWLTLLTRRFRPRANQR